MMINARNVNEAFFKGVELFRSGAGVERSSRNGPTLEIPEPVLTIYRKPWERVLWDPLRDANPFFHFFEALWMLAGRDDVSFLGQFVKRIYEYSDDERTLYGAYGYRWRRRFNYDQIKDALRLLREDRNTRRVVVSMWDPRDDLGMTTKDLPCNTHVYFKIRGDQLDMTTCCRSNDMIWGAYGANAVHFSVLQEYMAGHLGLRMGQLAQLSDSLHVYTESEVWRRMITRSAVVLLNDPYQNEKERVLARPLDVDDEWDLDLQRFFLGQPLKTAWWNEVASPMLTAFRTRSLDDCNNIEAADWNLAAVMWLMRRQK